MLRRLELTDIKLLREVSLDPGRLNVVVGRNSVGKSTVLRALDLIMSAERLRSEDPAPYPEGPTIAREAITDQLEELQSKLPREGARIVLIDETGAETGLALSKSSRALRWWWRDGADSRELGGSDARLHWKAPNRVGSALLLSLDARAIAAAHYSETDLPSVATDGGGTASVLQYLQGLRDGQIEAIEAALAQIVPGVRRIRALPARVSRRERLQITINSQDASTEQNREVTGARFELEFDGLGWIPANHLSEGTLLSLGLLTALQWRPPSILLLDDLDKGLHPVAQRNLIQQLRNILDTQPGLQVLATSHSPFVLDELQPEEVFVAGSTAPGVSHIRRLTEHPSWSKRSGYMQPGEFWSLVGEDWVAGDPP